MKRNTAHPQSHIRCAEGMAETTSFYAAPEVIERLLFQRLDNFPTLSVKDHIKLCEHLDLLQEIQEAKEARYLPDLLYLDTSHLY